jgi:hypothetical protein
MPTPVQQRSTPTVDRPLTHAVGDVCGDVGIVDGIGPVTAAVDDLMADPFEQPDEPQPCRDSPMVTANGDAHRSSTPACRAGTPEKTSLKDPRFRPPRPSSNSA